MIIKLVDVEYNLIGSEGRRIDRLISHIFRHLGKRINDSLAVCAPSREGVGILRGRLLARSLAVIGGGRTRRYVLVCFENRAVVIFPCNGVGRGGVLRPVSHIGLVITRFKGAAGLNRLTVVVKVDPHEGIAALGQCGSGDLLTVIDGRINVVVGIFVIDEVNGNGSRMPDIIICVIAVGFT